LNWRPNTSKPQRRRWCEFMKSSATSEEPFMPSSHMVQQERSHTPVFFGVPIFVHNRKALSPSCCVNAVYQTICCATPPWLVLDRQRKEPALLVANTYATILRICRCIQRPLTIWWAPHEDPKPTVTRIFDTITPFIHRQTIWSLRRPAAVCRYSKNKHRETPAKRRVFLPVYPCVHRMRRPRCFHFIRERISDSFRKADQFTGTPSS